MEGQGGRGGNHGDAEVLDAVGRVVLASLPAVREVLAGTREWTDAQVEMFVALLNKSLADASSEEDAGALEGENPDWPPEPVEARLN